MKLVLYHRSGCSLCEAMILELAPYRERYGFELSLVDVDTQAELVERYGRRVPVLCGPDGELCHYFLDPEVLQKCFTGT